MSKLINHQLENINNILSSNDSVQNSFLGGSLGILFYYFHLYNVTGDTAIFKKAESLIENVFEDVNNGDPKLLGTLFSSGGAGLGYVVNYLQKYKWIEFDINTEFKDLDSYLFNESLKQIEEDNIDILHGGLGVLHYFASREQTLTISSYINKIVAVLLQKSIRTYYGIWFRNNVFNGNKNDEINFSLSHGLSGILLLLIKVYPLVKNRKEVEQVINDGIKFILNHKLPIDFYNGDYSFFPFSFENGTTELTSLSRLAWCYGDLNEVLVLYRAGKLFNTESYIAIADIIGLQTLARKDEIATMVKDSHFCHGSAGVAQFYKTLFKETENKNYLDGYEYWIKRTIDFVDTEIATNYYKDKASSFLEGFTGVALTLLDYNYRSDMAWSEVFFL